MSTPQKEKTEPHKETCSDKAVADYLRTHPEFFEKHAGLLAVLKVPHSCGPAVSLVERQVAVLREQNQQLRRKLVELVQVARDNDRLIERMQRLTLTLMDASSLEDLLTTLHDVLRNDFPSDAVAMRLFFTPSEEQALALPAEMFVSRDDPGLAAFERFFKTRRPLCGRLKQAQLKYLFGNQAEDIHSAVVLLLGGQSDYGILAMGSRDPNRFHVGMGTAYITRMGELISHALKPYVGRCP